MTGLIMEGARPPVPAEDLAQGMGVLHMGVWREIVDTFTISGHVYVSFAPGGQFEGGTYTVGTPVWAHPAWAVLADHALAEAAGPGVDGEQMHDA